MNNLLTTEEVKIVTQALFDLAEVKDITHIDAKKILNKIKSRQENIFGVNNKYNVTKKAF